MHEWVTINRITYIIFDIHDYSPQQQILNCGTPTQTVFPWDFFEFSKVRGPHYLQDKKCLGDSTGTISHTRLFYDLGTLDLSLRILITDLTPVDLERFRHNDLHATAGLGVQDGFWLTNTWNAYTATCIWQYDIWIGHIYDIIYYIYTKHIYIYFIYIYAIHVYIYAIHVYIYYIMWIFIYIYIHAYIPWWVVVGCKSQEKRKQEPNVGSGWSSNTPW